MAEKKNLSQGTSYTALPGDFDPEEVTLRDLVKAHADTLGSESGKKDFIRAFTGKNTQYYFIFEDYLDRPAIDFVETFSEDAGNPLVLAYEKNKGVNARIAIYSKVGAIQFHIEEQLNRAGKLRQFFPEGMPLATDRVVRPDKPKAKARRYSYNPGAMGEFLDGLEKFAVDNPDQKGVVLALMAQSHMGLRPGEIANAPASALAIPEKLSAAWGFFLDTDTPGVKMNENLNIAIGGRTYNILQQALEMRPEGAENLFTNPDGSKVTTQQMTDVIKQIKIPGIMTDELTGERLDAFQEAYDLRRMWVTLGLSVFPGQGNRLGAAQGRAIGAVTKDGGSVKEYYNPSKGFYGDDSTVVPNKMDAWLWKARVLELPEDQRPPEGQRVSYTTDFITNPTPIYEDADAPIKMGDMTAKYVEPTTKVEVVRPEAAETPKPSQPLTLKQLGQAISNTAKRRDVQSVAGGTMAGSALLFGDTEEVMASTVAETGVETGTRQALRTVLPRAGAAAATGPLSPAAIAAMVAAESVLPSDSAGPGELNMVEQMQLDRYRREGNIGVEKELMAREPITEIGGSDLPTQFGQRVTRQTSTDEMTFQDILDQRRQRGAMDRAIQNRFP